MKSLTEVSSCHALLKNKGLQSNWLPFLRIAQKRLENRWTHFWTKPITIELIEELWTALFLTRSQKERQGNWSVSSQPIYGYWQANRGWAGITDSLKKPWKHTHSLHSLMLWYLGTQKLPHDWMDARISPQMFGRWKITTLNFHYCDHICAVSQLPHSILCKSFVSTNKFPTPTTETQPLGHEIKAYWSLVNYYRTTNPQAFFLKS